MVVILATTRCSTTCNYTKHLGASERLKPALISRFGIQQLIKQGNIRERSRSVKLNTFSPHCPCIFS